jgi:hypothetical protein
MIIRPALWSTWVLIFLTTVCAAQSKEHAWGLSVGGGPQDYKSSVGNGFKFSNEETSWHGAGLMHIGTFVNPSLDIVFSGAIGDLGPSRLTTVGALLKYKFANGYLLDEVSTLKPYVFAGLAFNNLTDKLKLASGEEGNYMSFNAGLGVRYYILSWLHASYNIGTGYFITESTNFSAHGHENELFIHNALMVGIDLF